MAREEAVEVVNNLILVTCSVGKNFMVLNFLLRYFFLYLQILYFPAGS